MKFSNACRAGDRRRNQSSPDFRAPGAFGHLKKHRAIAKIHFPRSLIEAKYRVGAQSGKGLIGKSQFRARFGAGPHRCPLANVIIHRGRTGGRISGQQPHVLNDMRNTGFLEWSGPGTGR